VFRWLRKKHKEASVIGAAGRTAKARKPMREHAAANESLKLALHEQGGAAVEHPMLRRATHVGSRGIGAKIGVKLHG
jgi:hypothetical protein